MVSFVPPSGQQHSSVEMRGATRQPAILAQQDARGYRRN
jgi:hypothetical protein